MQRWMPIICFAVAKLFNALICPVCAYFLPISSFHDRDTMSSCNGVGKAVSLDLVFLGWILLPT